MNRLRTTAVVVSYQSRNTIPRAMAAAREAHLAGLLDCIVVDNDGTDGTAEFLAEEHPWAKVIRSGGNIGFGRACNLAIQQATTEFILLLNPDAELSPGALEKMIDFFDGVPRAGIVSPAIQEPDGGLQLGGGSPSPWRIIREALGLRSPYVGRRPIVPGAPPFRTDWLCAAVLLIRRRLFQEVGGFDPRYFLYFEETDLCRRASQYGWQIWAVGEAVAHHVNAASSRGSGALMYKDCIAEHYFRSRYYYLSKHFGRTRAIATELAEFAILLALALPKWIAGRSLEKLRVRLRCPILRLPSPVSK